MFSVFLSSVPFLPTSKNFCPIREVSRGLLSRGPEFVFLLLLCQTADTIMTADLAFQNKNYISTLCS